MGQGPLVTEETVAGADFISRFDKYMPVKSAFWLKSADDEQWYLYIASDRLDDRTYDLAYGEVLRLAGEMQSPYLDPFQVNLIRADDPLALSALAISGRYPGRMATRLRGGEFGGVIAEGVYLYPSPIPTQVT